MSKSKIVKEEVVYDKQSILSSKRFSEKRDILSVLLNDYKEYSIEEVNRLLNEFYEKEVK